MRHLVQYLSMLLLFVSAGVVEAKDSESILKVDVDAYPHVKIYFEAPEGSSDDWKPSNVELVMEEALAEKKRKRLEAKQPSDEDESGDDEGSEPAEDEPAEDEETSGDEESESIPSVPESVHTGSVLLFDDQKDSDEGRLVVFLVDTSSSMKDRLSGTGLKRISVAQKLMRSVVKDLKDEDKVTIVRFSRYREEHLPPTSRSQYRTILDSIDALEDKATGDATHIFDSLQDTIKNLDTDYPEPLLEGRRFFFLITDGNNTDKTSRLEASDLQGTLVRRELPPYLFAISVGPNNARKSLYKLASYADQRGVFFEPDARDPNASNYQARVRNAFYKASKPLQKQFLVEFDVSWFYWKTGTHRATLEMPGPTGDQVRLNLSMPVSKIDQSRVEERSENQAYVDEVWEAYDSKKKKNELIKKALIFGSAGLSIGFLAFYSVRKSKRVSADREQARQADMDQLQEQMRSQDANMRQYAEEQAKKAADAARRPLALLVAADGPLKGHRFAILKARCLVGRDPDKADMVFPEQGGDAGISRVHAEFALGSGSWMVTCMSDGGMSVGASKLRKGEQYPIQYGDALKMGSTSFFFERV